MHINDIENIMNYLFSAALKKCGNFEDAEDLTSETLLAALKYPEEIKDMKKWLSAVLNHKYYDMLRRKYKLPTVSINLISEDIPDFEEEQADMPSAEEIRREVAYLSGKYREVKPRLDIPVIPKQKYDELDKLRIKKIYEFADMFEPLLREIMPDLKIDLPKHLEGRVAEFRKYKCYAFPMAVIKEAMDKGDFYSENCTLPMVMVVEE